VTTLLDANVLIALVVKEHVHHDIAAEWLSASGAEFATCPITQGSLVRFLVRKGQSAAAARDVVSAVAGSSRHEFWPDNLSFADVKVDGVVGHRQVTAAYLAQLARKRKGQLATLDNGLAHLHSDVAVLIPAASGLK
jgi:toxin-antitoxin system PIN domain toxin